MKTLPISSLFFQPLYSVDELSERLSVQTDLKVSTVSYFDRKFEPRYKFKWGNRALGRKGPVPFKLKIFKGYKNAILRRDFVVSQNLTLSCIKKTVDKRKSWHLQLRNV